MANIIPFKALRPAREKAGLVVSKPYEEYDLEELEFELDHNPYSFLHIINPEYKFKKEISEEPQFQLVRNRYQDFKEEGVFIKDTEPSYYIYSTRTRNQTFCGIIAAVSVLDYENNLIKKHEDTLAHREKLFKDYLEAVGFNTEPVLLTYPENENINRIMKETMSERPEYEFTSLDKDTHFLWKIDKPQVVAEIRKEFEKMPGLYIADGHHRSASSYMLAKEREAKNHGHTGAESYNFFMSYLISESHLKLYEFNRLVKDLNGWCKKDFLIQLDECFRIENRGNELYRPSKKHHFSMYLEGEYYSLYLRKGHYEFNNSLSALDPYILYMKILKPILGVNDPKCDSRLAYSPGKNDALDIKKAIDTGEYAVGFGMLPLSIEELKKVSEEGLTMPPKSTYIEPKLRSGLLVYEF